MAEDEQQRHTEEEFVKLTFELCKHLTTLSTAGALVVLAVYREIAFGKTLLAISLVLFGLSVLVSLVVMQATMTYFTVWGRARREQGREPPVEPFLLLTSGLAGVFFVVGVSSITLYLLDLPAWALIVLTVALLALLLFIRYLQRKRS